MSSFSSVMAELQGAFFSENVSVAQVLAALACLAVAKKAWDTFSTSFPKQQLIKYEQHMEYKEEQRVLTPGQTTFQLEDIGPLVHEMRTHQHSNKARPFKKRIAMLQAVKKMLTENREAIMEALRQDLGRPDYESFAYDYNFALGEVNEMLHNLKAWLQPKTGGFSLVTYPSTQALVAEPKGLVLVIGTWNFPFLLCVAPMAAAIAAGNTVLVKPSNISPATARLVTKLVHQYLDKSVVRVLGADIKGDRHTTSELLNYPFDHVFFTGSPSVGAIIAEKVAKFHTTCTLELGGKNPVFVDKNSDLEHAAKRVVWGRMLNAGQQCIAPDYVLCDAAVVDEFSAACERQVKAMYPTRGDVARIVDQRKMKRITDLYNATLKHPETKIVVGGEIDAKAKYFAPTVLRVSREAALMQEETFGPVLLITTYTDVAEAIAYVNSRDKPLSLYVFSDDAEYQQQVSQNTSSGGVTINAVIFHCAHPELPFGGVGASGCGAYHGQASIDCFTHWKPVLKKGIWKDGGLVSNPFFLYPPVSASKLKWLEMAIGN